MVRKISLSPLENAILGEISEAGAEDVPVIMNALVLFGGGDVNSDSFIGIFEQAIRRLHVLKEIELVFSDRPGYPPIQAGQIDHFLCLREWVCWETEGGYWRNALTQSENIAVAKRKSRST